MTRKNSLAIPLLALMILSVFLAGCGGPPRNTEDFIKRYNREIGHVAKDRNFNANAVTITNPGSALGMKGQMLADENIIFAAETTNAGLTVSFTMDSDLDSDILFGVIEGTIPATGGDTEKVLKGMGIQTGTRYRIPAYYQREYRYDKHTTYSVVSGAGIIIFSAEIQ